MNDRLTMTSFTLVDPTEGNSLGTLEYYFDAIFDMTIVAVSAAPENDAGSCTVDIDDDGTNVISGVDASDANVPGTWKSTHVGGTNAPVHIAAGSKVSFDVNSPGAGDAVHVVIWSILGEVSA